MGCSLYPGMLRRWDDSQKYLSDNPYLVCEETANYLVIWCIDLEVEEVGKPLARDCLFPLGMGAVISVGKEPGVPPERSKLRPSGWGFQRFPRSTAPQPFGWGGYPGYPTGFLPGTVPVPAASFSLSSPAPFPCTAAALWKPTPNGIPFGAGTGAPPSLFLALLLPSGSPIPMGFPLDFSCRCSQHHSSLASAPEGSIWIQNSQSRE